MDKEKYPYKTSELFKEVQFISDTIKGDNPYFYNIWNLMSENTYNALNLMFVIMTAIYSLLSSLFSTQPKPKYSQTCIKRSPFGQRKTSLLRQVTS